MDTKALSCTIGLSLSLCFLNLFCHRYSLQKEKNSKWRLAQFTVQPSWTEKDKEIPFLLASVPESLPESYRLEGLPTPGNQGSQASGTAWALGYFAVSYTYRKSKGEGEEYQCSPAFIYNSLNHGVDKGIEIVDALELVKKQGCPREKYMPYNAADAAYRPSSRARRDASNYRIRGFARVDYTDLDQLRSYLLQNKPVIITLLISENFIALEEQIWSQPQGKIRGRHSLALVGYNDKKGFFYLLNSVGSDWGAKGLVAIPYSWFIRLTKQAYILW